MSHVGPSIDLLNEFLILLKGSLNYVGGEVSLKAFDPSLDKFINDEEAIKGEEFVPKDKTYTLKEYVGLEGKLGIHTVKPSKYTRIAEMKSKMSRAINTEDRSRLLTKT